MTARPKLIVFDLDYTLWPYWTDTHIKPPFITSSDGAVHDRDGKKVQHFPSVPQLLQGLVDQGYTLAVASRTSAIRCATELITAFGWQKFFAFQQIYPGSKTRHFEQLKKDSGFEFEEMLLFDDEERNLVDLSKIGVLMILIDERVGVTQAVIDEGLQEFAARAARQ